jgi:hypothetical protein
LGEAEGVIRLSYEFRVPSKDVSEKEPPRVR